MMLYALSHAKSFSHTEHLGFFPPFWNYLMHATKVLFEPFLT